MREKIALLAMVIVLAFVNWSIAGKERQLAEGRIVYLELAPVDPRSLMQGDYMRLRFKLANEVYNALPKEKDSYRWRQRVIARDGKVVVKLDDRHVGQFVRIDDGSSLSADEVAMRYRVRNKQVRFATNAYYFQEGQAQIYRAARFGQFRVGEHGELLLTAMYDKDLNRLGPDH
jgi:uncharacterized membrane-anchored protein